MKKRSASASTPQRRLVKALAGALVTLAALLAATTFIWAAAKPAQNKPAVWPPPQSAEEVALQEQVREIALTLHAPCCPNLTVAQHDSPTTLAIKKDIHDMLKEGKQRGEIVAALKAKYGDAIMPSFISAAWRPFVYIGGPVALLALVLLGSWWMLRHEKEPIHLDEGHWMEEGEGKAAGGPGLKKAS